MRVFFAAAASLAWAFRARRGLRLAIVAVISLSFLVAPPLSRAVAASGTTLFVQQFNNNTVNPAYPVSLPSPPPGGSSVNSACLTASGNTSGSGLISCPSSNDAQGSGTLRLTSASANLEGGVFAATSVPTSQGIDATFNTYQYGGTDADGIAFVLAAVNPASPLPPGTIGQSGGSLGYSAISGENLVGLADAYMGIGLDVHGNFSNSVYEGSGCTNPPYISTNNKQMPGQVVIRGPGVGLAGYCAINSSAASTSSPALTLRASTRTASVVPVEVAINPTSTSFTTASGITVPAGTYAVQFTPVGGSATTLTGALPTVPSGLYPSSWTTSAGIPKQLAFGWVASTGGSTDFHEINNVNVVSFSPVPQLAVSQTSYVPASPATGTPVTYAVSPGVSSSGAGESNPVSVTETMPAGVTPVGAYGSGWTCGSPSGQTITCTNSATPFAAGTSLPAITVQGIVTNSSVTASTIQSGSTVTASSSDGDPGIATSTTAGTLPVAPSGVTLSPATGPIAGGNAVTISGTNITGATAIEIGTAAQQAAGTSTVLLPCPGAATAGCFTLSGSTLSISSMPSVTAGATVNATVVTQGASGSASYVYTTGVNPVTGTQGFAVFVAGNLALNATAVAGPVALGGNLSFGPASFNVATQTQGSFTASGDSKPTGLLVGGNINWSGSSSTGSVNVQSSYMKIGNMTGSVVAQSGSAPTHVVPTGNSYSSSPQLASTLNQPTASVTQSGLINFTSAFSAFATQSAGLAACTSTIALNASNGKPLPLPLPSGTNAYLTLTPGTQNVLDISAANLANISLLQFQNAPSATMPLVINVDTSGVGNTFTWTTPNINGLSASSAAPYILWNFFNATQLTISGSATVPGTIYAPGTAVNDYDGNGLAGGVIAASLAVGGSGGNPNGGQILSYPFTATLSSCSVQQLTISLTADTAAAVPGGTVHYTVTATNSGTTAYTGATFTDSLSDVLDDASYNGDASATAGSVAFASPNLTWTGSLAAGAAATITFSVTVNKPDTGNRTLASTITSATAGSNCASGSTDPRCSSSIPVQVLTITATANASSATPGSVVGYTVTVTNSGLTSYTGAAFTDSLSGVLDDAVYNGDASATGGSLSYVSPGLMWTGSLAAGAAVTVTFSVTVSNPDTGDKVLVTAITSPTPGSNCPVAGPAAACGTSVPVLVPGLTIVNSAGVASATPGSVVGFTVTITDTGQTAYTGITVADSLSGVLDDAVYDGDASATAGSVSYASPVLTWTGSLAAGAVVSVTFSVTVNAADTGDKTLGTVVSTAAAGSNCGAGSTDARCSTAVPVLVPGLTLTVTANTSSAAPGSVVGYTVVADNTGQTADAGVGFTASLAGVLDDAVYNGNASATAGTVSYASPVLSWTGSLAAGAAATVTFSVTVNNPDTGNHLLAVTVASAAAGNNCPAGGSDPRCASTVGVAQLAITNTANVASATPGGVVRFTATFANTGQVPYTGITISTNAADVFDDAVPDGDQTATSGTLSINGAAVVWTGNIPVGGTVTVTGTVTVNNPDTGNHLLASTITTAAPGSNCPAAAPAAACSVSVPVLTPGLTITNTPNTTTPVPGSVVGYTLAITNTGQTPYTGITVAEDFGQMLDDAAYDGDAAATAGTLSYASPVLTWTGSLAVGATATVTFTVTVHNPDTGDKLVIVTATSAAPGSACPAGTTAAPCRSTVAVLTPGLEIVNTAGAASAVPGATVHYTVTITDTGQTAYAGITVTDDLSGLLDDAAYDGDAAAGAGSVSYASPDLTWSGSLSPGAAVTVTFSVTVNNPDTGNRSLATVITTTAAGSNCAAGSTDPGCATLVLVENAALLTMTITAGASSAVAGGVVQYTVTVANAAATPYAGAAFTVDLSGVLDDAVYGGNAAASTGTVTYTAPDLAWAGTVAAHGTATITYTVTVNNPDTGNKILASTLTSASAGGNCGAGSTDPACSSTVTVSQLVIDSTADVTSATPGSVVSYTTTLTNAGQTPYFGITMTADGSGLADDATSNGDEAASSGTLSEGGTGAVWTGNIPVGATVTITGSITVDDPDTGNHVLTEINISDTPGSNCPAGSTDPRCGTTIPVLIPALTITNTPSTTTPVPGSVVGYTLAITNTGQTAYTGITVAEDFGQMLDDAAYDNDASATTGTLSYAAPVLTWTGSLAVGATATVTFTVTVHNPDTGDKLVIITATSAAAGSACPPGTTAAPCRSTVAVLTPALAIAATAGAATVAAGGTVHYTVTITDTGQTPYTGITVTDDLSGLLDDAAYDGDAAATAGSVAFASPDLAWAGSLTPGAAATVTFSVTVANPDTGNKVLATLVTTAAAGSNCGAGSTDPACATSVPVAMITMTTAASTATTTPGAAVGYTITVTNTGQVPLPAVTFTVPLAGVLDDAAYNGDAGATSGLVSYAAPDLTWTGALAVGAAATITFTVTVDSPGTGGATLTATVTSATPGASCPASGPAPAACTTTVTVLIPALTITKTASTATTTPGSVVQYTITITDTGQTPYTGATVTDDLTSVLDDAAYNNNAAATAGLVSYTSPVLTWTGNLDPGDTAVITFTITISNPDTGDKHLVNTVTSTTPGSTCPPAGPAPACTATVTDLIPALTITKTATTATTTPGSTVGYTITITDTGQTPYTAAAVTDDLTGVLADAAYNNNAATTTTAATAGTLSYTSPDLTWTGDLNPGDTTTITYTITVTNPDTGNGALTNTVTSTAPGSTCPPNGTSSLCTVTTGIIAGPLTITAPATAALGSAAPGGTLSAALGTVQVTDGRGFGADWTATVSATDFTTGDSTPAETIPAANATYTITSPTTTGPATFTHATTITLSGTPQTVITATSVDGNTTVTWNPAIQITIPPAAIGGAYTATITHSVS